jgi:hypothetical protein
MWLEVAATNKNIRLIVKYFIDCIRQVGGLPIGLCVQIAGQRMFMSLQHNDFCDVIALTA